MALTIEDGTGVEGADSYATALELADRAAAYGWALPSDTGLQEVLLRRAAQVMESMPWQGERATSTQGLTWPRSCIRDVDIDSIPAAIKNGQMALAAEIYADDIDPPELRRGAVKREKVDVLEVEYAGAAVARRVEHRRASDLLLAPYIRARGMFIRAVRA